MGTDYVVLYFVKGDPYRVAHYFKCKSLTGEHAIEECRRSTNHAIVVCGAYATHDKAEALRRYEANEEGTVVY